MTLKTVAGRTSNSKSTRGVPVALNSHFLRFREMFTSPKGETYQLMDQVTGEPEGGLLWVGWLDRVLVWLRPQRGGQIPGDSILSLGTNRRVLWQKSISAIVDPRNATKIIPYNKTHIRDLLRVGYVNRL